MAILSIQNGTIGQSGQIPKIIYINTNNTIAEITNAGFLNGVVSQGIPIAESDMALVVSVASPGAPPVSKFYSISFSSNNWSLVAT